jgi:hypothetical protein
VELVWYLKLLHVCKLVDSEEMEDEEHSFGFVLLMLDSLFLMELKSLNL